ncbi:MAG: peptide chain release factor N(5)-glutamine methyltransferase [Candidatus Babeliaceae bacterium]|jgi:release factor glutamine methyltransferase
MKITALVRIVTKKLIPLYQDPYLAANNAWAVIEKLLHTDKIQLIARDTIELSQDQQHTLDLWIKKLTHDHMPLQYLLGTVPFLDIIIAVQPPVLIPRPETEEWCDVLIKEAYKKTVTPRTILDMCTGSGCIGLSLAHAFPQSHVTCTDVHRDALDLTHANAQRNNIRNVTCVYSDIYDGLPKNNYYDLIVANPPYIDRDDWATLQPEITKWEDIGALVAEDHGYALIEKIITGAQAFITTRLPMPQLWIEIGSTQGKETHRLMLEAGFAQADIIKDWYGKDRVVVGTL